MEKEIELKQAKKDPLKGIRGKRFQDLSWGKKVTYMHAVNKAILENNNALIALLMLSKESLHPFATMALTEEIKAIEEPETCVLTGVMGDGKDSEQKQINITKIDLMQALQTFQNLSNTLDIAIPEDISIPDPKD